MVESAARGAAAATGEEVGDEVVSVWAELQHTVFPPAQPRIPKATAKAKEKAKGKAQVEAKTKATARGRSFGLQVCRMFDGLYLKGCDCLLTVLLGCGLVAFCDPMRP